MTDSHAATELELYIDNDADLYRQQTTPILKNLATKKARGEYKHDLAVKAFGYLVEAGAKKYVKEFGTPDFPWHKMFDVPTRRAVAESFAKSFETEFALGNYDQLLPKKYQTSSDVAESHRKKIAKQTARMPEAMRGVMGGGPQKSSTQLQREIDEALAKKRRR